MRLLDQRRNVVEFAAASPHYSAIGIVSEVGFEIAQQWVGLARWIPSVDVGLGTLYRLGSRDNNHQGLPRTASCRFPFLFDIWLPTYPYSNPYLYLQGKKSSDLDHFAQASHLCLFEE